MHNSEGNHRLAHGMHIFTLLHISLSYKLIDNDFFLSAGLRLVQSLLFAFAETFAVFRIRKTHRGAGKGQRGIRNCEKFLRSMRATEYNIIAYQDKGMEFDFICGGRGGGSGQSEEEEK